MGVWGFIFEFEGTSWGSRRELICEFESLPLLAAAAAAAAAAAVQADGQTAHWLHGENDSCCCTCASLNQRSNPLLPLAIFTDSVWMPQRKAWRGCERRRSNFSWSEHAWAPPRASSSQPCPLLESLLHPLPAPELPFPLQLLMVSLLSS
jgi:hypothetical protein